MNKKIPRIGGVMNKSAMEKRFPFKGGNFEVVTTSSAYGITAKKYQRSLGKGKQYNFVRRYWDDEWVRTRKFFDFAGKNPKGLSAKAEALIKEAKQLKKQAPAANH